jgi:pSer/pThr/pTyr-binding forkhead associated (FHA) protein
MQNHLLEFSSRAGEFLFRQPVQTLPATLGRALDNHFVIDDPYVAARHIIVEAALDDENALIVRDLGSRNGVFFKGQRVLETHLRAGDILHFGHSTLRLRQRNETVAPERLDTFASSIFSMRVGIILVILIGLTTALTVPMSNFGEIAPSTWLGLPLSAIMLVVAWAALWAMFGKLFARRAHFAAHLAITGWAYLVVDWGTSVTNLASFAFSNHWLEIAGYAVVALSCIWGLQRQLALVQLRWPRINLPVALLLFILPATFWVLNIWDQQHRLKDGDFVSKLYDPALRISKDSSLDDFVGQLPALASKAEALRHKNGEQDGDSSGSDEDED